jgi:hypothetical protein
VRRWLWLCGLVTLGCVAPSSSTDAPPHVAAVESDAQAQADRRAGIDEGAGQLSLRRQPEWSATAMTWTQRHLEIHERALLEVRNGRVELHAIQTVELDDAGGIVEAARAIAPTNARPSVTHEVGPAGEGHRLIIGSRGVELHDRGGAQLEQLELEGTHVRYSYTEETGWISQDYSVALISTAISHDLRYLAVAASDGSVHLRDRDSGSTLELWLGPKRARLFDSTPPNIAYALHADGKELWALTRSGELWRWRLRDGALLERRASSCDGWRPVAFSPSGSYAAATTDDGLCIWSPRRARVHLRVPSIDASALAFDVDDRLAVLDAKGRLHLWTKADGLSEPIRLPSARPSPRETRSPRLSADGRYLHWPVRGQPFWRSFDLETRTWEDGSFSPARDDDPGSADARIRLLGRRDEWPTELRSVAWVGYSADRKHLLVSQPDALYVLSHALELEATVELIGDEHWLVTTPSGAVDGSAGVQLELLSVIEEPGSVVVQGGSLAWDRFEVRGLLALLLAGQHVSPMR